MDKLRDIVRGLVDRIYQALEEVLDIGRREFPVIL